MAGRTGVPITAHVSRSTKERLERFARSRGLEEGPLVEDAVLHHLKALEELPADVVIPPRLVVSAASWSLIQDRIASPRKPTPAMVKLQAR